MCSSDLVADIFQSGREDHYRKGAGDLIFTEVKEVDASCANFYSEYFAGDAFGFPDMLARFVNGDAVGSGEKCCEEHHRQQHVEPADRMAIDKNCASSTLSF